MFNKKNKPLKSVIREYLATLGWAILIALLIRTWGVQAFQIPSSSMEPTLLVGDHLLVSKSHYGLHIPHEINFGRGGRASVDLGVSEKYAGRTLLGFGQPQRGDIIVFRYPEDRQIDFIKRVIALPGETVQIQNKTIFINGQALEDPWGHFRDTPEENAKRNRHAFGPAVVPPGHYFVMGDNRDNSLDSRYWFSKNFEIPSRGSVRMPGSGGFVPEQDILGKALILYWSWDGADSYDVRWPRIGSIIN